MRVGITYDLADDYLTESFKEEQLAEFDSIETVIAIEETLRCLGFETEKIGNVKHLVGMLSAGKTWDMVFNIAEGMYGTGREALVPALLDAYQIPYTFSDPLVLALTLHKGMAKHVMNDCAIPTPAFTVAENVLELETVSLPFPLFIKPVAEGTGKGISAASIVNEKGELIAVGSSVLARYSQPVLIEKYLPGREFTVGIIGTGVRAEALPAMEIIFRKNSDSGTYSYHNKKNYRVTVEYRLVDSKTSEECRRIAMKTWQCLGCRDAGRVDLRLDEHGVPNVMEVNPLAGLHPRDSDLPMLCSLAGMNFQYLIERIMESALVRIGERLSAGENHEISHTA